MSFFDYKPQDQKPQDETKPQQHIPSDRIIIDGSHLIKLVDDNPEIPDGKVDIGNGMSRRLEPLNYNPETGVIEKWA